jgi:hypothetical protein
MKKIVSLFLWFCAATFLAQLCIVGLSIARGNFKRATAVQIIALLNGIDIQGQRLKQVLVSARNTPVPTYEDVLNGTVQATLDLDSRKDSLDRQQERLESRERALKVELDRLEKRLSDFKLDQEKQKTGAQDRNLNEMQKLLETLSPESAKSQLLIMLEKGQKSDVVAIVKGLPSDKQKKILGEFTSPADQQKLAEVLLELRNGDPRKPPTTEANKGPGQP